MDFNEQLAKRLRSLERLSQGYDRGDVEQGVELAGPLSVIFHDTGSSVSLLRHLGKKDIRLASTCRKYPGEWTLWPIPNLTGFEMSPEVNRLKSVPAYDGNGMKRFLRFGQWWDELIFRRGFRKIRRRDLVFKARNHDGIGHVDNSLPPEYEAMVNDLGIAITNMPDEEPPVTTHLRDGHAASLRQVAYEALNSPELLALAPHFTPTGDRQGAEVAVNGWNSYLVRFGKPYY